MSTTWGTSRSIGGLLVALTCIFLALAMYDAAAASLRLLGETVGPETEATGVLATRPGTSIVRYTVTLRSVS